MSESYQLPIELWNALQKAPKQRITFEHNGHIVEVSLLGKTKKKEDPPLPLFRMEDSPKLDNLGSATPLTPPPPSKMKLQLLDDSDHQLRPPTDIFAITPEIQTEAATEKLRSKDTTNSALRTHDNLPPLQPIGDFLEMVESEKTKAKGKISEEIPIIMGNSLEDTQADPEDEDDFIDEEIAPPQNEMSPFENAFLEEEDEGWLVTPQSTFRVLRATDTPKILELLFGRLDTALSLINHLLPKKGGGLPPEQLAKAAGVTAILEIPVPFSTSPDAPPNYHLVGQTREKIFILLYQDEESLHYVPIPRDGGEYQIALVEGEELLTDEELTQLFKEGAREATPEQAEASAREVQDKLRRTPTQPTNSKLLALSPPSTGKLEQQQQQQGLEKTIPVNQRLLNRLEYNRNQDHEYLWDESLQAGVSVFRYNIATLYKNGERLIEGVLLCIIKRKQYLVFDRRSKRSVPLTPSGEQRIWLRHDENLA